MYCQCPNCETIFALSQKILETREGLVRCGSCREVFNASWYLLDELPPEAMHAVEGPGEVSLDENENWQPPDTSAISAKRTEESPFIESYPSSAETVDHHDSTISEFDTTVHESETTPVSQGPDTAELQIRLSSILDVEDEVTTPSESPQPNELPDSTADPESDEEIVLDSISLPRTMQDYDGSFEDLLPDEAPPETVRNTAQSLEDGGPASLEAELLAEALSSAAQAPPPTTGLDASQNESVNSGMTQAKEVESLEQEELVGEQISQAGSPGMVGSRPQSKPSAERRPEPIENESGRTQVPPVQTHGEAAGQAINASSAYKSSDAASKPRENKVSSTADDITLVEIPRLQPMRTAAWWLGSIFLVLLALFQLKQFYLVDLAQFGVIRPYLKTVCHYLGCEVPPRHEFVLIELIDTRVNPDPDTPEALRVTASLISRAAFEQHYPHIQVTLTDRVGRIVGRRTYSPKQYLGTGAKVLVPNVVERITLDLVHPDEAAVGYELELVSS